MPASYEYKRIRALMVEGAKGADPGPQITRDLVELKRIARRLTAMHEKDCNEGIYLENEIDASRARAREILARYGLGAWFQSDPRGYVFRVIPPGVTAGPDDGPTPHDGIGVDD